MAPDHLIVRAKQNNQIRIAGDDAVRSTVADHSGSGAPFGSRLVTGPWAWRSPRLGRARLCCGVPGSPGPGRSAATRRTLVVHEVVKGGAAVRAVSCQWPAGRRMDWAAQARKELAGRRMRVRSAARSARRWTRVWRILRACITTGWAATPSKHTSSLSAACPLVRARPEQSPGRPGQWRRVESLRSGVGVPRPRWV